MKDDISNCKFMLHKETSMRTMVESMLLQIMTSFFFLVTWPF